MGNTLANNGNGFNSTLARSQKSNQSSSRQEGSRVLFLLYLIHKTWNVVVDSVDTKGKKRRSTQSTSEDSGAPESFIDSCFETDPNFSDESTLYGSQYSFCSCNYCYESKQNAYYSSSGLRMSICESELSSFCIGYQMAPSACHNPLGTQICSPKMMMDTSVSWPPNYTTKENQRPPVYNPEDYTLSLKKFGKRQQNANGKSIYDTNNENDKIQDNYRAQTLPAKCSEYKSPIQAPPENDCEMSLRQFGSITDLLTKLRADLRAAFPSFVQEFVSPPLDGVSLLLEVLRAIQLSQTMSTNNTMPSGTTTNTTGTSSMPRNSQSYQRRALLDELACLQCLSICCCRSPEASSRLGTTPVGLLPLAASATGQGIRARILALQLLTAACDKSTIIGTGTQKSILAGHAAVSEALSTLRLRCGEPVRFRLLIGMLNSGGGSGELQAFGIKFINTFLESSESLQNRLYLQAELFQAGFDANNITKTISSTSPWLEKLRAEIKHFDEIKIDVEKLQLQARESERIRSQMVILERRVQILQEEKAVLTSMERRLQERCAELQREVFRLQGAQSESCKSLDKRPIALPRHVPPTDKQNSSEHEDEGISSSETGQSLSPVPILVLPQKNIEKFSIVLNENENVEHQKNEEIILDDVIDELNNIAIDAERQINGTEISIMGQKFVHREAKEQEIVPVNVLPQPPRKSRSLAHLVPHGGGGGGGGSDLDASEYGLLLIHNNSRASFFDDLDFETDGGAGGNVGGLGGTVGINHHHHHHHIHDELNLEIGNSSMHPSTNRDILDVIMQARETEDDPTMNALRARSIEQETGAPTQSSKAPTVPPPPPPPQHFNGVFFMTEMNTPQKYPKPDIAAALQAKRVSKNLERIESYGLDSMVDIVLTPSGITNGIVGDKSKTSQQIYFGSSPTLKISTGYNGSASHINNVGIVKHTSRTRSHAGSKVTDIPSGLY